MQDSWHRSDIYVEATNQIQITYVGCKMAVSKVLEIDACNITFSYNIDKSWTESKHHNMNCLIVQA